MSPVAVVLGGATSVWSDLAAARKLLRGRKVLIVAANFAGIRYKGPIDAWVTLHPEELAGWIEQRAAKDLPGAYRAFVHDNGRNRDWEQVKYRWYGSSGLYGAQIALDQLGAAGVILCGVPMETTGNHIETPDKPWPEVDLYRPAFLKVAELGLPIRSMGGWTAETLGRPDEAWLKSIGAEKGRIVRPRQKEETVWIRMTADHPFTPLDHRAITIDYRAEQEYSVRRRWGEAMIARGVAEEIDPPARQERD